MADKIPKPYQFEPVVKEINRNLSSGRRNISKTEIWETENTWRLKSDTW